jgi:hypothetical protein
MKVFVLTEPRMRTNARGRKFYVCSALTEKQEIATIVIKDTEKLRRQKNDHVVMLRGHDDSTPGTGVIG